MDLLFQKCYRTKVLTIAIVKDVENSENLGTLKALLAATGMKDVFARSSDIPGVLDGSWKPMTAQNLARLR